LKQTDSWGSAVDFELEEQGLPGRVQWVSSDGHRVAVDLGKRGTATLSSDQSTTLEIGQPVLVDDENSRIWPVEPEIWPEEKQVGVVKIKTDDLAVIEFGSQLKVIEVEQDVDFSEGNTVAARSDGKVLSVLSKDPIRLFELPSIDDAAVETFKTTFSDSVLNFDDFGGYPELKARARELIETPLEHHEQLAKIGARPIKGVLFTGLPGTGKTMLARIIAARSGATFFEISGPEIFSKWYGQSEELLRKIFDAAAKEERAIIFFDEIDSVAGQRDEDAHEASKRVVAQLLTRMDGFTADQNVVVVATTNRPDDIDVALRRPGRFDWEIDFPLPTYEDRVAILETASRRLATGEGLPHHFAAKKTEGWSGAELTAIWTEAALLAVRDNRDVLLTEDFLGGLERVGSQKSRLKVSPRGVRE